MLPAFGEIKFHIYRDALLSRIWDMSITVSADMLIFSVRQKVKGAILLTEMWAGYLLTFLRQLTPYVDVPQSVTYGNCDARSTVTFPAAEHCHCPLVDTHFLGSR